MRATSHLIVAGVLSLAAAPAARAQDFPLEDEWVELDCGGEPMTDAAAAIRQMKSR